MQLQAYDTCNLVLSVKDKFFVVFSFLWPCHVARGIFVPVIEPVSPALGMSLDHWTANYRAIIHKYKWKYVS